MRNESLYLTAAQILPTLLIALVLELRLAVRAALTDMESVAKSAYPAVPAHEPIETLMQQFAQVRYGYASGRRQRGRKTAVLVAVAFLLGEWAAISAVVFGVSGWLAWVTGLVTLLSLAVMSVVVVWYPLRAILYFKP